MASKAFGWTSALFGIAAWMFYALPLTAQDPGALAETPDAIIEQMSRAAGVIFAGEVTAVRRPAASAYPLESVAEVDFRVDLAVRGPAAGSVYTLREWAGLWTVSQERYRTGQRLLVFLYKPGSQGCTSPVHGTEGLVPLRGGGVAPGPDDTSIAPAEWMVDLRWLQAQTFRSAGSPPLGGVAYQPSRPRRGIVSETEPENEQRYRTAKFAAPQARRLPTPWPQQPVAAPVTTEPLAQVVALCQKATRGSNAIR